MDTPRRIRWVLLLFRPKVTIPAVLVLMLCAAPFAYRALQIAGLPDIGDPFDVTAFGTVLVPAAENAFVDYAAAASLLVAGPESPADIEHRRALAEYEFALAGPWENVTQPMRQWLDDNRPALEMWRKGTEQPQALYCQPQDMTEIHFHIQLPLIDDLQWRFAELAQLRRWQCEAEEGPAAAWPWYRAIFRCSRHVGRHGSIKERLAGLSLYGRSAVAIERWSRNPQIEARQLRQALADIRFDFAVTEPASMAIKCEYLIVRDLLGRAIEESASHGERSEFSRLQLFLAHEPQLSRRVIQQAFANVLDQIDRPRHARGRPGALDLYETAPGAALPTDRLSPGQLETFAKRSVLAPFLLPAFQAFTDATDWEQARQAALVMALAVQIYRREQGRLPERSEELVGGVLDALPGDPFGGAGDVIRYRRTSDEHFVVWSVGLNGVDDGGTVVRGTRNQGDIGFDTASPPAEPRP